MSNIIGPIDLDDWYLMRMLRESVKHAENVNAEKYKLMINAHKKTYKHLIKECLQKAA